MYDLTTKPMKNCAYEKVYDLSMTYDISYLEKYHEKNTMKKLVHGSILMYCYYRYIFTGQ